MTDSDGRHAGMDGRREGHREECPDGRERDRTYPGARPPGMEMPSPPPAPLGEIYLMEEGYPMGQPYSMEPLYPMYPVRPMYPAGEMYPSTGAPGYGPMYMWSPYAGQYPAAGATAGMPMMPPAAPGLDEILATLYRAHGNLSLQCAVSSLGQYVPAMGRLPGFEELHRENYEVAYHLTTAIGAARRILAGAQDPEYPARLVTCLHRAEEHQERAVAAFRRMAAAAPPELRPTMLRLGGYIQATAGEIDHAIALVQAALGPRTIAQLQQWAEGAGRE